MSSTKQDTQPYKMRQSSTDAGNSVRYLGKAKIGKLISKGTAYPQLCLPRKHSDVIGDTADVYETAHDGKQAFLVVTEKAPSNDSTVLNLDEKSSNRAQTCTSSKKQINVKKPSRGGVAWLSYGPVEATTRVRISPSASCFLF